MKTSTIFFLIMLQSVVLSAFAQQFTYSDIYDLDFTMRKDSLNKVYYPWKTNMAYAYYSLDVLTPGPHKPLYTKKFMKNPLMETFKTEIYQQILLPEGDLHDATLSLELKGHNIDNVSFSVEGLSEQEELIYSKTVHASIDTVLQSIKQELSVNNTSLINIRINVLGKEKENARISFSKMKIEIDGKPIDEYPVRYTSNKTLPNHPEIEQVDCNESGFSEHITAFGEGKIIGLGESMHGNRSIQTLVYEIIKDQVESQKCKMVLLESPIERTLLLNRYIQNKQVDSIELPPRHEELLNFLRAYNLTQSENEKVRLFGLDYIVENDGNEGSLLELFDYVTTVNKLLKSEVLDQLAILLMEKDETQIDIYMREQKKQIEKQLSTSEYDCLYYCIQLNKRMGNKRYDRLIQRDSVMFLNTEFLINQMGDSSVNAIIYAHAGHLNPVSSYPAISTNPLGFYLKRKYNDAYRNFIVLSDFGDIQVRDANLNIVTKGLDKSIYGSMEEYFLQQGTAPGYLAMTSDFDRLVCFRCVGFMALDYNFFPANFYRRFNGVFFVRNKESELKEGTQVVEQSHAQSYNKFLNKTKARRQLYNELKSR